MGVSKINYCLTVFFTLITIANIAKAAEDSVGKINGNTNAEKQEVIESPDKNIDNCQDSLREILLLLQSINSTVTDQNIKINNLEALMRANIDPAENGIEKGQARFSDLNQHSTVEVENITQFSHLSEEFNFVGNESSDGTVGVEISATQEALSPAQDEFQNAEGKVLHRPHALLYTGENLTGFYEQYDFQTPTYKGGCYNLQKYEGKIRSVDTEGTCVRIFSGSGCRIWSQAIYPGVDVTVDPKLRGVMSIGPCVQNEFEHVIQEPWNLTHITIQKIESKTKTYGNIPDLIPDYFTYSGTTAVYFNSIPVYSYRLGYGSRMEALAGSFHVRHMRTSEEAEANRIAGLKQSFYEELALNTETDEPGYAFPLELGGPADKRYNVFAQNMIQAAKYRAEIVPEIKNFLATNTENYVRLTVNFFYENATSTRPSGMWYLMYKDGVNEITYGYIPN